MKGTGIKVTPEELDRVLTALKCSGMYLSGGEPMGNPQWEVKLLADKYNPPEGSALNTKTGEFCVA